MKISAVSSGYRTLNFGRSLNKAEMDGAYKAAQEARNLMGFQDGNSLLIVPAGKLPQEQGQTLTQKLIDFFESAKKLLGINTVEITGNTDDSVSDSVKSALKQNDMRRMGYFDIPNDPDELISQVEKLADEYDGLRINANKDGISAQQLNTIEETFKRVKGDKFDPNMLIFEHGQRAYDWGEPNQIASLYKGRTIVTSSNNLNDNGVLWGSRSFVTDRMGAKQGEFIHGLRNSFEGDFASQINNEQIKAAEHLLETELKLHDDELLEPARFAAAKRADVASSKNFYRYLQDVTPNADINVENFQSVYQKALQEGMGDNYFDSLAKVMKAMGLDESSPELYDKICGYRNALFSKGAATLEELAQMSEEQLAQSYKDSSNIVLQGKDIKAQRLAAQEEARKIAQEANKRLQDFLSGESARIEDGRKLQNGAEIFDQNYFDKAVNFARKNKKQVAIVALAAAVAAVGATMYSYGREISQKEPKIK